MPKRIENPFPFFAEAADAASRYAALKREHLTLLAELTAKREGRRAAYGAGALISLHFALLFALGWLTVTLHEDGVAAWALAVGSLVFFGALGGWAGYVATRSVKPSTTTPASAPSVTSANANANADIDSDDDREAA